MKTTKPNFPGGLGCFKRFLLGLAVFGVLFAIYLLIGSERESSVPRPKAVRYWIQFAKDAVSKAKSAVYFARDNSSSSRTSILNTSYNRVDIKKRKPTAVPPNTTSPIYFDYQWTTQWGKQNKTAWQLVYGDLDCPDNPRRASLTAIIKKWSEIAEKHNIQYALFWGSLIGIVRNNDVIPWDHDMDLLVHYKDILVLEKLGWPRNIHEWDGNTYINAIPSSEHNKSMDDRLRWDCQGKIAASHVDSCSIQEPLVRLYNRGAFLDVFHFFDLGDSIVTTPEEHRAEIKKKDFFPLRRCLFMGVQVLCPNNPIKLLSDWYGPDVIKSVKKCKHGRWL